MKRLLLLGSLGVVALVGVAAALAASGGSGGSTVPAPTGSVKQIAGAGSVIVDAKGRALYTNDQEHGKLVLCTGACLSFWTPLTVTGTPKASPVIGKLAVLKRPDGKKQVTLNGKLLYSFTLDKPGKVTGDGFHDAFGGQKFTWHVARSGKGMVSPPATTPTTTYPGY